MTSPYPFMHLLRLSGGRRQNGFWSAFSSLNLGTRPRILIIGSRFRMTCAVAPNVILWINVFRSSQVNTSFTL